MDDCESLTTALKKARRYEESRGNERMLELERQCESLTAQRDAYKQCYEERTGHITECDDQGNISLKGQRIFKDAFAPTALMLSVDLTDEDIARVEAFVLAHDQRVQSLRTELEQALEFIEAQEIAAEEWATTNA
jgi:hypothetical protein